MSKVFKKAHYDENLVVKSYWDSGFPALRVPISGAGNWKGDVLAICEDSIHLVLVRRTRKEKAVFKKSEIKDVFELAEKIKKLINVNVIICYVVHFIKKRKWVSNVIEKDINEDLEVKL